MIANTETSTLLARRLEEDGIVIVPNLIDPTTLRAMQRAFESRLSRLRWNDFDGFEMTEPLRHMVQNVLTLEQGFVDLALHPVVKETLSAYLGEQYALAEAKGWRSLPTQKDFHFWHGDGWYDQSQTTTMPREVKLAFYLTDVRSGAFQYIKGSHGQQAPRRVRSHEVQDVPPEKIVEATGPAGTAILFDTSGIHRQSMPILERRHALFYAYHDPRVPLQAEDVAYNRYHPLLLNAAFLGNLSDEDTRILGFGDKTQFQPAFTRAPKHTGFQAMLRGAFEAKLRLDTFTERVAARARKILGRKSS
jgi:hypothetical protein